MGQDVEIEALARIRKGKLGPVPVAGSPDLDASAAVQGLPGVGKDVVEGPVEQILVAEHPDGTARLLVDFHARPGELPFDEGKDLAEDKSEIHGILPGLAGPGVVEEVVHGLGKANGLVVDGLEQAHGALVLDLAGPALQKLRRGADDAKGVAYLVGNARHHAAHAHEPLGALDLLLELAVLLHAQGKGLLGAVDDEQEQREEHHRGEQAHDHDDALEGQHLHVVGRDVLGQLEHAEHGRAAKPEGVAAQGIEHAQLEGAGIEGHAEEGPPHGHGCHDLGLRHLAGQHLLDAYGRQPLLAYLAGRGGIGHHVAEVVEPEPCHGQALDDGLHHLVQPLVLGRLAQGDAPVGHDGRHGEALENLVVEVLGEHRDEVFLTVHERLPGRVGDEEGKAEAGQKHDHQGEPGKGARKA